MTEQAALAPGSPKRPHGRKGLFALIAAVVATATLVAVLVLGGEEARKASPLPAGPTPLDLEATELVSLLSKGRDVTFHARYEGTVPGQATGKLVIEVWRTAEQSRQDAEVSSGTQIVHTAAFRRPDGTGVACRRQGDAAWQCAPIQQVAQPTEQLIDQVTGELAGRAVTVRNDQIRGRTVRCFSIAGEGQTSEICATRDGIPVLIKAGDATLELTQLETAVDQAVFKPPA